MKLNLNKIKYPLLIIFFVTIIFIVTVPTIAHKVILYAYVEGGKVVVEGGFGDGSAAKNAVVKVYNSQNELLNQGITNNSGLYEFEIPAKTDLKIVLNAGMGHQAEYTINKDKLPDISIKNSKENKDTTVTVFNEDKLRGIISQEIDKKITPLNRKLLRIENNKGPGITEILGGIGYILGIMGFALYFTKGRNK
ncbi:MAG: hypothetical protein FH762_16930 [Firmicutes bacterium]|nr:hypothetical protein [Bacillota bacterium]